MKKKIVRLTENDLHKVIKKSVNKILEGIISDGTPNDDILNGVLNY